LGLGADQLPLRLERGGLRPQARVRPLLHPELLAGHRPVHRPAHDRRGHAGGPLAGVSAHRLSLVVPTRDTREVTLRCLESAAPLIEEGAELVLVDDGSRDGTAEAVRARFPAARVLVNDEQRRFGGSANRGLAEASREILLLLNSDTEVDPRTVPAVVAAFDREPRLGAAGAELRNADGTPQWSAGAALAVRRAAWEECGPFDEGFGFYGQDVEFCLRLGDAGWNVRVLPGWVVT